MFLISWVNLLGILLFQLLSSKKIKQLFYVSILINICCLFVWLYEVTNYVFSSGYFKN